MRPWLVGATHVDGMPLATVVGELQVLPAFAEDTKPTPSCVLRDG
jgi:hypothetical protein